MKRHQIVTVGVLNPYRGRILRRADSSQGWWLVREIPADAERAAFLKRLPRAVNAMLVHESQLS